MNYELCKRLKDAGFVQQGRGRWYALIIQDGDGPHDGYYAKMYDFFGDIYVPTLSELIEACGDSFKGIVKTDDGIWEAGTLQGWDDGSVFVIENTEVKRGVGTTVEEAVAALWLTINKK